MIASQFINSNVELPNRGLRLASLCFGISITIAVLYLLGASIIRRNAAIDPPPIQFVEIDKKPIPPKIETPAPQKTPDSEVAAVRLPQNLPVITNAPPRAIVKSQIPTVNNAPIAPLPRIANGTPARSNDLQSAQSAVSAPSRQAIHQAECEQLDQDKRPADCPPTSRARIMVKAANAPKYQPDQVVGFSAVEYRARRAAGWRDRCETNEGGRAQVCLAIGRTPPRVKTPKELCEEKGLGPCATLPPAN